MAIDDGVDPLAVMRRVAQMAAGNSSGLSAQGAFSRIVNRPWKPREEDDVDPIYDEVSKQVNPAERPAFEKSVSDLFRVQRDALFEDSDKQAAKVTQLMRDPIGNIDNPLVRAAAEGLTLGTRPSMAAADAYFGAMATPLEGATLGLLGSRDGRSSSILPGGKEAFEKGRQESQFYAIVDSVKSKMPNIPDSQVPSFVNWLMDGGKRPFPFDRDAPEWKTALGAIEQFEADGNLPGIADTLFGEFGPSMVRMLQGAPLFMGAGAAAAMGSRAILGGGNLAAGAARAASLGKLGKAALGASEFSAVSSGAAAIQAATHGQDPLKAAGLAAFGGAVGGAVFGLAEFIPATFASRFAVNTRQLGQERFLALAKQWKEAGKSPFFVTKSARDIVAEFGSNFAQGVAENPDDWKLALGTAVGATLLGDFAGGMVDKVRIRAGRGGFYNTLTAGAQAEKKSWATRAVNYMNGHEDLRAYFDAVDVATARQIHEADSRAAVADSLRGLTAYMDQEGLSENAEAFREAMGQRHADEVEAGQVDQRGSGEILADQVEADQARLKEEQKQIRVARLQRAAAAKRKEKQGASVDEQVADAQQEPTTQDEAATQLQAKRKSSSELLAKLDQLGAGELERRLAGLKPEQAKAARAQIDQARRDVAEATGHDLVEVGATTVQRGRIEAEAWSPERLRDHAVRVEQSYRALREMADRIWSAGDVIVGPNGELIDDSSVELYSRVATTPTRNPYAQQGQIAETSVKRGPGTQPGGQAPAGGPAGAPAGGPGDQQQAGPAGPEQLADRIQRTGIDPFKAIYDPYETWTSDERSQFNGDLDQLTRNEAVLDAAIDRADPNFVALQQKTAALRERIDRFLAIRTGGGSLEKILKTPRDGGQQFSHLTRVVEFYYPEWDEAAGQRTWKPQRAELDPLLQGMISDVGDTDYAEKDAGGNTFIKLTKASMSPRDRAEKAAERFIRTFYERGSAYKLDEDARNDFIRSIGLDPKTDYFPGNAKRAAQLRWDGRELSLQDTYEKYLEKKHKLNERKGRLEAMLIGIKGRISRQEQTPEDMADYDAMFEIYSDVVKGIVPIRDIAVFQGRGAKRRSFVQESDLGELSDAAESALMVFLKSVNRNVKGYLAGKGGVGKDGKPRSPTDIIRRGAEDVMRRAMEQVASGYRERGAMTDSINRKAPSGDGEMGDYIADETAMDAGDAAAEGRLDQMESAALSMAESYMRETMKGRGKSDEEIDAYMQANTGLLNSYIEMFRERGANEKIQLNRVMRLNTLAFARADFPDLFNKDESRKFDLAYDVAMREVLKELGFGKDQLTGRAKDSVAYELQEAADPGSIDRAVAQRVVEGANEAKAREAVIKANMRKWFDNADSPFIRPVAELKRIIKEQLVAEKNGLTPQRKQESNTEALKRLMLGIGVAAIGGAAVAAHFVDGGAGISLAAVGIQFLPLGGGNIPGLKSTRQVAEQIQGRTRGFIGALMRRRSTHLDIDYLRQHNLSGKFGKLKTKVLEYLGLNESLIGTKGFTDMMEAEMRIVSRVSSFVDVFDAAFKKSGIRAMSDESRLIGQWLDGFRNDHPKHERLDPKAQEEALQRKLEGIEADPSARRGLEGRVRESYKVLRKWLDEVRVDAGKLFKFDSDEPWGQDDFFPHIFPLSAIEDGADQASIKERFELLPAWFRMDRSISARSSRHLMRRWSNRTDYESDAVTSLKAYAPALIRAIEYKRLGNQLEPIIHGRYASMRWLGSRIGQSVQGGKPGELHTVKSAKIDLAEKLKPFTGGNMKVDDAIRVPVQNPDGTTDIGLYSARVFTPADDNVVLKPIGVLNAPERVMPWQEFVKSAQIREGGILQLADVNRADAVLELRDHVLGKTKSVFEGNIAKAINSFTNYMNHQALGNLQVRPAMHNMIGGQWLSFSELGLKYWGVGLKEAWAAMSDKKSEAYRLAKEGGMIDPNWDLDSHLPPAMRTKTGDYTFSEHTVASIKSLMKAAGRTGMKPFEIAERVNRLVTYFGAQRRAADEIAAHGINDDNWAVYAKESAENIPGYYDLDDASRLKAVTANIAHREGLRALARTAALYTAATAPKAFRGPVGRAFLHLNRFTFAYTGQIFKALRDAKTTGSYGRITSSIVSAALLSELAEELGINLNFIWSTTLREAGHLEGITGAGHWLPDLASMVPELREENKGITETPLAWMGEHLQLPFAQPYGLSMPVQMVGSGVSLITDMMFGGGKNSDSWVYAAGRARNEFFDSLTFGRKAMRRYASALEAWKGEKLVPDGFRSFLGNDVADSPDPTQPYDVRSAFGTQSLYWQSAQDIISQAIVPGMPIKSVTRMNDREWARIVTDRDSRSADSDKAEAMRLWKAFNATGNPEVALRLKDLLENRGWGERQLKNWADDLELPTAIRSLGASGSNENKLNIIERRWSERGKSGFSPTELMASLNQIKDWKALERMSPGSLATLGKMLSEAIHEHEKTMKEKSR